MTDDELEQLQADNHYLFIREIDGDVQAVSQFIYTFGILAGVDSTGYTRRYCYTEWVDCLAAWREWDGTGEPDGWHRAIVMDQGIRKRLDDGSVVDEKDSYPVFSQ